MTRREFITLPAQTVAGLALTAVAGNLGRLKAAQAAAGNVRVPLRFFTEAEARTIEAACERIFPGDARRGWIGDWRRVFRDP